MSKALITAKTAGFCFGVKRAVDTVIAELDKGHKVATLGPIIHNPQLVEQLSERGTKILSSAEDATKDTTVIVRSHGVEKAVTDLLDQKNIPYIDATCPFVAKIHKIVGEVPKDALVIIAGDRSHPEVMGIIGHTASEYLVIKSAEELETLKNATENTKKYCIMVAQTTFNMVEWKKCITVAKRLYTNIEFFDTICNATAKRQEETAKLAEESDLMIVVGGKHSSNTGKLFEIASAKTNAIWIETAAELSSLNRDMLFEGMSVAITAGASTPVCIIKEVQETMSEILNLDENLSFEEMLEQSLKTIHNGEKVTAVVTGITPTEVTVDVGTKHTGYVALNELTEDPTAKAEDIVKVGDVIELIAYRVNDVEGTVHLSKKRLDAIAGFEKVMDGAETGEIFEGIITEVIKGGVLALTGGVKVFIPASHATLNRTDDLTSLLKTKVRFKILEANRQRRRAVGSVREVLREERRANEDKVWATLAIGNVYNGVVKSMTDYGAFVDLGGVDGMVHISELSWKKVRHPSQVLSIGDTIEVYVKDIDEEKRKISLGYKKDSENPWVVLQNTFNVGDTAKAKIVSLTAFGAFAEILPGIDGLIHISQIANQRVNKPADVLSVGDEVDVKITEIDYERGRISLSIKALLAPEDSDVIAEATAEMQ